MVNPPMPPRRKNPLARSVEPTLPPQQRSRAAHGLTQAAAQGRFALQRCTACGTYLYPMREACSECLSDHLEIADAPDRASLLSETTVRVSSDPYFRERLPWRIGLVQLDCGPQVVCHLHDDCAGSGSKLRLSLQLDKAGQAVFFGHPAGVTENADSERKWREMTADPKHRRILITDGRNEISPALAQSLREAGAARIYVGVAEDWKPDTSGLAQLRAMPDVTIVELDLGSDKSVQDLSRDIGAKVDIMLNNADHVRPGALFDAATLSPLREGMERTTFGFLRLAQAFGPVMGTRSADGVNSAAAWVNILSVHGLSCDPAFGVHSAIQAANLSLSHWLRHELRMRGVRVMNVFTGPTETEWYQTLPPPKVGVSAVAAAVLRGLQQGREDVFVGDIAEDLRKRLTENPKAVEREAGR